MSPTLTKHSFAQTSISFSIAHENQRHYRRLPTVNETYLVKLFLVDVSDLVVAAI